MQPAPDRRPEPQTDAVLLPRGTRRARSEVSGLVARVRAVEDPDRRARLAAVRARLESGELDGLDAFRDVARRLLDA